MTTFRRTDLETALAPRAIGFPFRAALPMAAFPFRAALPMAAFPFRAALPMAAFLLVVEVGCTLSPTVPNRSQNIETGGRTLQGIEREIHEGINAHRRSRGLPPLEKHPLLDSLARDHSTRMASGERSFSHDGFDDRYDRMRAELPVRAARENVSTNNYPAHEVSAVMIEGWLNSKGHCQNLEARGHLTGVGIARRPTGEYFATQIYVDLHTR